MLTVIMLSATVNSATVISAAMLSATMLSARVDLGRVVISKREENAHEMNNDYRVKEKNLCKAESINFEHALLFIHNVTLLQTPAQVHLNMHGVL